MSLLPASILIVDDEELNSELLKRKLVDDGHHITVASNGKDALELTKIEKFDLILLDIMLPDINGVTVLEEIRKNSKLDLTQVMMVTANGDREMVLRCIEAGATDYLVKPYAMPIVKSRIWRCLKNAHVQSSISYGNVDIEDANILLVDDQELNRDVLAHRLYKSGYTITSVANGKEALETLGNNYFDLVLLDIMMPDISGVDVLKEIRRSGNHSNTPVIMVTALDDIDTINECMEAGADDYIMKPLNTTLLKIRMSSCLQSRRVNAA